MANRRAQGFVLVTNSNKRFKSMCCHASSLWENEKPLSVFISDHKRITQLVS